MKPLAKAFRTFAGIGACCAFFSSGIAAAGEFSVNPIRLELGAAARSGVIAVKNEGKDSLSFQLAASEWLQDSAGKDQYVETRDLVFFPKIMTIEPGQDGIIRIGAKQAVVSSEKTYRLFIEELPNSAKQSESKGAQVNVLIRFGAPIFVAPLNVKDSLEIDSVAMAKGTLTFSARNSGNRHQVVQGIQLKGTDAGGNEVYALTMADRYLLAGTTKPYTTSIGPAQCSKLSTLEVQIKTDKASAKRKLDVGNAMCP